MPGIDDGPEVIAGSLEMARVAVAMGISVMAATPHLRSDFPDVHVEEIAPRCANLQALLDEEGISLRVVSGAEISLVWALEATDEQLRQASYAQRGQDLLIETPGDISMIENRLFAIQAKGFRVTLAHPERCPEFQRTPERLQQLTDREILLQLNARPLRQAHSPPGRLARHLCREGLAHAVASDGHRGAKWRPVSDLPAAVEPLSTLVGADRARWMTADLPAAILAGAEPPPAPPVQPPRPRRLAGRLSRLLTGG